MSDQKYRVRFCLLYDFKQGKTAAESHRTLCNAFGEGLISETQCRYWFQRFRDGDESLKEKEHERRPQMVNNEALKEAIELDPTQTTRELAETFGCTHTTISTAS